METIDKIQWSNAEDKSEAFFTEEEYENFTFSPSFEESLKLFADKTVIQNATESKPNEFNRSQNTNQTPQGHTPPKPIGEGGPKNYLASPKPGVLYPHFSSLTEGLVRYYRYLFNKFVKDGARVNSETDAKERKEFEMYSAKIQKDQQDFQQFLKQVAQGSPQDYMVQFPGCKEYVEVLLQMNRERVKQYPQFYRVTQTVSLNIGAAVVSDPVLTCLNPPKYLNDVPLAVLPNRQGRVPLLNNVAGMIRADQEEQIEKDKSPSSSSQPADIVISMATLETLVDNQSIDQFANSWEIPFEVLEASDDQKSAQKTIFFGEPFSKHTYYSHEANHIYSRNLLRVFLLKEGQNVDWKMSKPFIKKNFNNKPQENIKKDSDDIFGGDASISDLETFGSSKHDVKVVDDRKSDGGPNEGAVAKDDKNTEESLYQNKLKNVMRSKKLTNLGVDVEDHSKGDEIGELKEVLGMEKQAEGQAASVAPSPQESSEGSTKNLESKQCDTRESLTLVGVSSHDITSEAHQTGNDESRTLEMGTDCQQDLNKNEERTVSSNHKPTENVPPKSISASEVNQTKDSQTSGENVTSQKQTGALSDQKQMGTSSYSVIDDIMNLSKIFQRRKSQEKQSKSSIETPPEISDSKTSKDAETISGLSGSKNLKDEMSGGSEKGTAASSDVLKNIMKEQQDYLLSNKPQIKKKQNLVEFVDDTTDESVVSAEETQVLWKLGKLRILVKTKVDGLLRDKVKKGVFHPVTIHPKLEYQHWFGYEQVSASEQSKLWLSLHMIPGSKVIRGRINAQTSELMMSEVISIQDTPKYSTCFNPGQAMKLLHSIFNKLLSLPDGQYLLTHNPGVMHACIYNSIDPSKSLRTKYDLHSSHEGAKQLSDLPPHVPWAPIDPGFQPPGQHHHGQAVTCIFPPRPPPKDSKKRPNQDTQTPGKKKKKKKKKKSLGNFV